MIASRGGLEVGQSGRRSHRWRQGAVADADDASVGWGGRKRWVGSENGLGIQGCCRVVG